MNQPTEEIVIVNKESLHHKLTQFLNAGPQNIQIIADFDFSLTKMKDGQNRRCTSFGVLQNRLLGQNGRQQSRRLYNYYHPIQINPQIPLQQKSRLMHQWFNLGCQMLQKAQIYPSMISEFIRESQIKFRDGIQNLFSFCEKYALTFTIVSAGVANVIQSMVDSVSTYQGIRVFSNQILQEGDRLVRFRKPGLISFNKNKVLQNENVKPFLFLIGDMISDIRIVEKCHYNECIKIGFVNDVEKYDLEEYRNYYDVLVVHDGDLYVVEYLLARILGDQFNFERLESVRRFHQELDFEI